MKKGKLILTRRPNQKIIINGDTAIEIMDVRGRQVRLSIVAPKDITVHREEIQMRIVAGDGHGFVAKPEVHHVPCAMSH